MTLNPSNSTCLRRWLKCRSLGSGCSGQVFLAMDVESGDYFAVKSGPCSPAGAPPSAFQLLLDNELHILQTLSSPNVIRCIGDDFTIVNGCPVSHNLFLEYMEGGSLADLVKRAGGRLQESQVVATNSDTSMGAPHGKLQVKGTPLWMAPEVVRGREQGFPSDIWSLGCTVVEMLQGRPPWGHITDTVAALYKLGCSKECPPLPEPISDDARDFLLHCLQVDPTARWTAAQLLQHPFVCAIDAQLAAAGKESTIGGLVSLALACLPKSPLQNSLIVDSQLESMVATVQKFEESSMELLTASVVTPMPAPGDYKNSGERAASNILGTSSCSPGREVNPRKRRFTDAFLSETGTCNMQEKLVKQNKLIALQLMEARVLKAA